MVDCRIEQEVSFNNTYSQEEAELNKRLYEECSKEIIDCNVIEELLKQGADPLGGTATSGEELFCHVYGEVVSESQENNSINLPRITELFLQYGMDIDHPRMAYDGERSLHPMWDFAFAINENSIYALQMLLNHGLSADAVGQMWTHAVSDMFDVYCVDPCEDLYWRDQCTWLMKAVMLCASYDHILDKDEELKELIDYRNNDYDIYKFRNWDGFCYEFNQAVVSIREKKSNREVWKFKI